MFKLNPNGGKNKLNTKSKPVKQPKNTKNANQVSDISQDPFDISDFNTSNGSNNSNHSNNQDNVEQGLLFDIPEEDFKDTDVFVEGEDEDKPKKKKGCLTFIIIGGILIVFLIFFMIAYRLFVKPTPAPVPVKPAVPETTQPVEQPQKEQPTDTVIDDSANNVVKDDGKSAPKEDLVTYKNGYVDFSIKYPTDWVAEERTQEKMNIITQASKKGKFNVVHNGIKTKSSVPLVTFTSPKEDNDTKLTVYLAPNGSKTQLGKVQLESDLKPEKILMQKATTLKLNGTKVQVNGFKFSSYKTPYKGVQATYKVGKNAFVYTLYAKKESDSYKEDSKTFQEVVRSTIVDEIVKAKEEKAKKAAENKAKETKAKAVKDKESSNVKAEEDKLN